MSQKLQEEFAEQLFAWEELGRGDLEFTDCPVCPEPPYVPFEGYAIPRQQTEPVDDGYSPSLLGRLFGEGRRTSKVIEKKDEAEPVVRVCVSEPTCEIGLILPPEFSGSEESMVRFLEAIDRAVDPVAFEIVGTREKTHVQFCTSEEDMLLLENALTTFFPEAVLELRESTLEAAWKRGKAAAFVECSLRHNTLLPLETSHRLDPFVGIIGALSDLPVDSCVVYQVIFEKVAQPWGASMARTMVGVDGQLVFPEEEQLAKSAIEKASKPLYGAVVRMGASGNTRETNWELLTRLGGRFGAYSNPIGNSFQPIGAGDYPPEEMDVDLPRRRTKRFGMLLGRDELIGLVHLPSQDVRSPKLVRHVLTTHPPPLQLNQFGAGVDGLHLGKNIHRSEEIEVYLSPDVRMRHMHVIGTPGSGKTNLMYNMICGDIIAGRNLAVLDPHGDLIEAILAQIPSNRIDDVVLLDPTDPGYVVGLNILSANTEVERTRLSSDLVSMFSRLSTSWGDQMNAVLKSAILAFLNSTEGGTLADLRRFLVDARYRKAFVNTITDLHIREYWELYFENLASKTSVGAIVTRLGEFLESPTIRYVLGQQKSTIDFDEIMNRGKIFLCKLPTGLVGANDAYLFGSLIVAKLQQTAMARQLLDEKKRKDFFVYIDEFQHFIMPSMAEIISETRKYRMGMILAHQRLQQLEEDQSVRTSIENMNTKIVFAVGDRDAKSLSGAFDHFDANDLRNLDVGQAIVRVSRNDHDFNLQVPFHPSVQGQGREKVELVKERSRAKNSRARAEVEKELHGRLTEKTVGSSEVGASPELQAPSKEQQKPATLTPGKGRGGTEHRAIVASIQSVAEKLGFPSSIEKSLPAGGFVDIEVAGDQETIAFEVCITTNTDHEIGNIRKCVEAGYQQIVTVCRGKRKATAIRTGIELAGLPEEVKYVQINYPVQKRDVEKILKGQIEPEPEKEPKQAPTQKKLKPKSERVIGERKLDTRFKGHDPDSKRQEKRALEIIRELMSKPPTDS